MRSVRGDALFYFGALTIMYWICICVLLYCPPASPHPRRRRLQIIPGIGGLPAGLPGLDTDPDTPATPGVPGLPGIPGLGDETSSGVPGLGFLIR